MEELKWYLLKGYHVRPDFHTGDDVPDLIVTPITGGIQYDLKHQWAAECEVEPPRNPGKITKHFKRNRDRGWPTIWISYLERHEDKLKSILREAGGLVINSPSWDEPFHYNFSHPSEVIVTHHRGREIWIEDLVELMENSRDAAVAAREGKTIYIRRERAKIYDPSTQKVEHIGNVDNYARMAKEEDDPAKLDEIIRAISRDIESVKIMGKLLKVLTDDSNVRIGRNFIWSGSKKVCKKDKLVWDDETREFLKASDMLARLNNRKQKAEREGKKWKSYFGYPA